MISLCTPEQSFDQKYSARLTNIFLTGVQALSKEHSIGLLLDNSPASIFLLVAAMLLGKRIALCPLKEPPKVIEAWLLSLGIKELFTLDASVFSASTIRVYGQKDWMKFAELKRFTPSTFFTIMRTSGSSAQPKSALHSAQAHCASAMAVNEYFNFTASSSWLLSLPLHHVSGFSIVLRALLAGAGVGLAKNYEEFLSLLRSKKVTHCSLVPAQVKRLLEEKIDLSFLDAIVIGGDALGEKERSAALSLQWPLYESYGLTESASMVWAKASAKNDAMILPHASIAIDNAGEIFVKAKSMFLGYIENEVLLQPFDAQGFFATGDLGLLTHQQLELIGRKSNRLISGGENIQVEEIEEVLEEHPMVHMCVVVGIKDDRFGERPVAFIKWKDAPLSAEDIEAWLRLRLAAYKKPDRFLLWPPHISLIGKKPRAVLAQYLGEHS